MAKKNFPLCEVYRLLEPGPVVLLTTANKEKTNVMAMSWYTMMEFEPPLVGCVISSRNYSYGLLKTTKECAINIPTARIAQKAVNCGNLTGAQTNKFKRFGLTPQSALKIGAPLIKECYANLECRLVDTKMLADYSFFILEVIQAWIDPKVKNPRTFHHWGRGYFTVDGKKIKLKSKAK